MKYLIYFIFMYLSMYIVNEVSIANIAQSPSASSSSHFEPCGFVIATDNVDKNIRRSHQRENRQTKSLHYCHSLAIKNRINISGLSDEPSSAEICVETFLPNCEDLSKLLSDFKILKSRYIIICVYMAILFMYYFL